MGLCGYFNFFVSVFFFYNFNDSLTRSSPIPNPLFSFLIIALPKEVSLKYSPSLNILEYAIKLLFSYPKNVLLVGLYCLCLGKHSLVLPQTPLILSLKIL